MLIRKSKEVRGLGIRGTRWMYKLRTAPLLKHFESLSLKIQEPVLGDFYKKELEQLVLKVDQERQRIYFQMDIIQEWSAIPKATAISFCHAWFGLEENRMVLFINNMGFGFYQQPTERYKEAFNYLINKFLQ